jgi:SpoIID/LytB domain protein
MEPKVNVGILWGPKIDFTLGEGYTLGTERVAGDNSVSLAGGKIAWRDGLYDELLFEPRDVKSTFIIRDVVIGIGFHWERAEDQRFEGALRLIVDGGLLVAVNIIRVEAYLTSVISSEMSATASLELLKAHAVISRTWLLAQIEKSSELAAHSQKSVSLIETPTERIRWWDREDHTAFDVCADDHCQRYQGVTRAHSNLERVSRAIGQTRGQILKYGDRICDARFSKCCGGVAEEFSTCWEDAPHPYLTALRDDAADQTVPDLRDEAVAREWILSRPGAFCNTSDKKILSQVMNDYDNETTDFYRWRVACTTAQLSELVNRRSGLDFGRIVDLVPVERGTSGRIERLKIVGSKKTLIIGKELDIRRTLSESHLYSSAFVVEKTGEGFILHGAGWGHGVGLCQIGAAVMGERGYPYEKILEHYYRNSTLATIY